MKTFHVFEANFKLPKDGHKNVHNPDTLMVAVTVLALVPLVTSV
jgi:hypothetical protein